VQRSSVQRLVGAALLAAAFLAVGPARALGSVLVVGDSLTEGDKATLERIEPGATIDGKVGRSSATGLSVLEQEYSGQSVVVFDLGTNDDPSQPGAMVSTLERVRRTIGSSCLVVATINRPPYNGTSYAAMNRAIEDFAARDGSTQVVPWLLATKLHPEVVYSDGVHVTPYGYEFRAHLIATSISSCPGGPAPVQEAGGQGDLPPPATAGVQPAAPAPAPPAPTFHLPALVRSAGGAIAGLVIATIDRLTAAVEQVP
jgi:lysophospholipase L1-like esterase